jgi:hypothetical protein
MKIEITEKEKSILLTMYKDALRQSFLTRVAYSGELTKELGRAVSESLKERE